MSEGEFPEKVVPAELTGSATPSAPAAPYGAYPQRQGGVAQSPYPQAPYPSQPPYPQAAYPQQTGAPQPYPQPGYPHQQPPGAAAYPAPDQPPPYAADLQQQAAPGYYPQVEGVQPPQYYGQPAAQPQSTVVLVHQQPTAVIAQPIYRRSYGEGALIFAVVTTGTFLICGCWWAIICSAIGLVLAFNAQNAANTDRESDAKSYQTWSFVCTSSGIVSVVLIASAFIIYVIVISTNVSD